jgi:hypothetical protein
MNALQNKKEIEFLEKFYLNLSKYSTLPMLYVNQIRLMIVNHFNRKIKMNPSSFKNLYC